MSVGERRLATVAVAETSKPGSSRARRGILGKVTKSFPTKFRLKREPEKGKEVDKGATIRITKVKPTATLRPVATHKPKTYHHW
jgi:hypothetical protein